MKKLGEPKDNFSFITYSFSILASIANSACQWQKFPFPLAKYRTTFQDQHKHISV